MLCDEKQNRPSGAEHAMDLAEHAHPVFRVHVVDAVVADQHEVDGRVGEAVEMPRIPHVDPLRIHQVADAAATCLDHVRARSRSAR